MSKISQKIVKLFREVWSSFAGTVFYGKKRNNREEKSREEACFCGGKILEKKEKKEYTVVEKEITTGGEFDEGVYPERRIEL